MPTLSERFHYIEDKMKRRDIDRMSTEKSILTTLEKLQVEILKLNSHMKLIDFKIILRKIILGVKLFVPLKF